MTKVQAYAAQNCNDKLTPFEYTLGNIQDDEVDIQVEYCGICHSDLSMLKNEWKLTKYPFIGGHEVVGIIQKTGKNVSDLKVGDRVGLGWHSGYCNRCSLCLQGDQNLCRDATGTIIGHYGGFGNVVRAQSVSVLKIPEGLDPKKAGPLFCAGITIFNPFVQNDLPPTSSVGIIGIGGLGHLAIKFAKAWGCEVTAFTSSEDKKKQALELGAHHVISSKDPAALEMAKNRFDLVISTVNVALDWNLYLQTIKPKGHLHFLGIVMKPLEIFSGNLIFQQKSMGGTPVGSPATIKKMLDFAALHKIEPIVEMFPIHKINEAFEHLESGKARFRIVLEYPKD